MLFNDGFLCSYSVQDTRGTWKWFGLTSFAEILLSLVWMPNNSWLRIFPTQVIQRCHLLETFRMTSLSYPSGMLQYHPLSHLCSFLATIEAPYPAERTAACSCFLITHCRQPTLHIRRCISDGVTPSLHKNHVVHLCPWKSPSILRLLSMHFYLRTW